MEGLPNESAQVYKWIRDFVVKHKLCPFAGKPLRAGTIRFQVCEADDWESLEQICLSELELIAFEPESLIETSLLIFPNALGDFYQYLTFVDWAQKALENRNLSGDIQIASFHPDYQFAESKIDDPANFTNRSPYPMIHFIREDSISRALENYTDPDSIPERNITLLRKLGTEAILAQLKSIGSNHEI